MNIWCFLVRSALLSALILPAMPALLPGRALAQPSETRLLELQVGDQTSIPAQGVKSYSEGVPGIVDVRLPKDGAQLVLLALKPGSTTLLLLMLDGREIHYRIEVLAAQTDQPNLVVAPEDNVRLDFYFVQVSEGYGHNLGVAWPDSVGGTATLKASFDLSSGTLTDASLGIAEQVLPRLDLAQRTGWARVSRQAAVIAENGKQAEFHSGGEVNVPIQGALTAEVRAIQYGSAVTVEPRFDKTSGRIELRVGAEMADLSDDAGTGIPGRHVAKLQTVVNLDLGKSLVLAGLDAASDARSTRGLPGLSAIPILGGLFGSRQRRSEHTKNLLFIVPTVVQAVPLRERNLVEQMLRAYEEFDGDVSDVTLLERTPKGALSP